MIILTGGVQGKVDRMDWEEATHRFHELDDLIRQCSDLPSDNPIMKEYRALKLLLETNAPRHERNHRGDGPHSR